MQRISIIGAGFGALTAVRRLRSRNPDLHLTLIAPRPEMVYYPSLIWIPSGIRQPDDLTIPLHGFLSRMKVHYHRGSAIGLEQGGRIVVTDTGKVENDGLIIASGGRFIKKLPGIEHAITPCEGIPAAVAIRDRLRQMKGGIIACGFASNPNEPAAMRGGPVFEFLFGIDTQLRRERRRDQFKIVFFSPAPEPGKRLGDRAVQGILQRMKRLGIETHLGHKLKRMEPAKVVTEGGEIPANLIIFMPGMTGNQWFDNTELPRSPGGLLQADAQCRVVGQDRIYVAGDSGSFPGPDWLPKQAHMADLQAMAAADNLLAELAGKTPDRTFKSELICIIDSLESGTLVKRTESGGAILPPLGPMHWVKRLFEWWYLRPYRA